MMPSVKVYPFLSHDKMGLYSERIPSLWLLCLFDCQGFLGELIKNLLLVVESEYYNPPSDMLILASFRCLLSLENGCGADSLICWHWQCGFFVVGGKLAMLFAAKQEVVMLCACDNTVFIGYVGVFLVM